MVKARIKFLSEVRADKKIFIEVSNNLMSQVVSRAFAMILREIYGYRRIYLYDLEVQMTEYDRQKHTYEAFKLELSREHLKT